MSKYLIIVESPAKAKTIKKFLGKNYSVEASMGHIRDLPKSQIGVDIDDNYQPKYVTIRGKGSILDKLKKEAKKSEKVLLATDPDREGEAISWHLANYLQIDCNDKCRIEFNEITKNAIKNAVQNPRPINFNVVDAQQARRILDRLVGYKISPILWKKVKKGLSAGRVQSVATRLICDREEEIENFIPKEYWSLVAWLHKGKIKDKFEAKFYGIDKEKVELSSKNQVDDIVKNLNNKEYIVDKVRKGERKRTSPPPFTTSSLQQEASRKLNYPTKKTMMVAQQLYEGVDIKGEGTLGLVTYIRTDSIRISDEARSSALEYISNNYGREYSNSTPRAGKKGRKIQDAHECIRPTDIAKTPDKVRDSLSNDQFKLYKLIWDRFVASLMSPAQYDTITADILADKYLFKASGSLLRFNGFLAVYVEGSDEESDEKESKLPELKEGEKLILKDLLPAQHFTQPPPRYTEATLVKILEEQGIGRPSTYAPTIGTILSRGYVVKEKKHLIPTELGKIVTDIMKEYFKEVVDIDFTAQMENRLDDIEEGEEDWVNVIDGFYRGFKKVLESAEEEIGDIEIKDEVTEEICEHCGRNLVVKMGRYGKFLACPGFPECRNTKPIVEDLGIECPKCDGKIVIKKTKKGRSFYGCTNYPGCDFVSWDKPTKEKCPECGDVLVSKEAGKKTFVKCNNNKCKYKRNN